MKRIASHYFLREDGTLGRFPVIEVDNSGVIVAVTEYDTAFTETAGVSFFGGIIAPGFIGYMPNAEELSASVISTLGRNGFLRFAYGAGYSKIDSDVAKKAHLSEGASLHNVLEEFNGKDDLEQKICSLTKDRARLLNLSSGWGSIMPGSKPGIIVLEGVNLNTFVYSHTMRVKILIR